MQVLAMSLSLGQQASSLTSPASFAALLACSHQIEYSRGPVTLNICSYQHNAVMLGG